MRVYRKVLAAAVDTNNLGCHTTKDWKVIQRYEVASNSYNYTHEEGEQEFIVWISIKADDVNTDATAESNKNFAHEKEVVLLPNRTVKVEIYSKGQLVYKGNANTGSRYDKWVSAYL